MNQTDVIETFKSSYMRKHGCAWFIWDNDNPVHQVEKTGGWASIAGEPAFEFHRPQDLPKDIIWWTNLTKAEAWSLGRWSYIKHAGFLGPNWSSLMSEWGYPQELNELKIACSIWSEIFSRLSIWLSVWSSKFYEQGKKPHPNWSWGDGEFYEALGDKLDVFLPKDKNTSPILNEAYCDLIVNELGQHDLKNKRKITLTFPRIAHAKKILANRYPLGDFVEVPLSDWPSDMEQRWDWIKKQTCPLLIRFDDITWKEDSINEAKLWWGMRGRKFSGPILNSIWLTAEEALEMHEFTQADPSVVLMAFGWQQYTLPIYWPKQTENFLEDNSIVSGLLYENLWRSLSTPLRTPSKRLKSQVSAQAIWWRSADRRACFQLAQFCQKKGWTVISYGEGTVTIGFDPQKTFIQDWSDLIEKTKITVPKMIASSLEEKTVLNSENIDRWLKQCKSLETWKHLDRIVWPWLDTDKLHLKKVLEKSLLFLGHLPPPMQNEKWLSDWKSELVKCSRKSLKNMLNNSINS